MSSAKTKKPPQVCLNFEPQTWRKNLCKNCFKTIDQHGKDKKDAEGNSKKDKDKAKDKDKPTGSQGLVGKTSSGGKQKGEESKQEKSGLDKTKKDGDIKDEKDKKDKQLLGRFAGKAKEKVIEAAQVVEKKTAIGGKKKGTEQKADDKTDIDKTKGIVSKKGGIVKKTEEPVDRNGGKQVTPKVKKKWPFESPVEKAKGKFQADSTEPKSKDSPKVKAKKLANDKPKESPKVKQKVFQRGNSKENPKEEENDVPKKKATAETGAGTNKSKPGNEGPKADDAKLNSKKKIPPDVAKKPAKPIENKTVPCEAKNTTETENVTVEPSKKPGLDICEHPVEVDTCQDMEKQENQTKKLEVDTTLTTSEKAGSPCMEGQYGDKTKTLEEGLLSKPVEAAEPPNEEKDNGNKTAKETESPSPSDDNGNQHRPTVQELTIGSVATGQDAPTEEEKQKNEGTGPIEEISITEAETLPSHDPNQTRPIKQDNDSVTQDVLNISQDVRTEDGEQKSESITPVQEGCITEAESQPSHDNNQTIIQDKDSSTEDVFNVIINKEITDDSSETQVGEDGLYTDLAKEPRDGSFGISQSEKNSGENITIDQNERLQVNDVADNSVNSGKEGTENGQNLQDLDSIETVQPLDTLEGQIEISRSDEFIRGSTEQEEIKTPPVLDIVGGVSGAESEANTDEMDVSSIEPGERVETADSISNTRADKMEDMSARQTLADNSTQGSNTVESASEYGEALPTSEAPPEANLFAAEPPVVTSLAAANSETGAAKSQEISAHTVDTEFTQNTPTAGVADPSNQPAEDKNTLPLSGLTNSEPRKEDLPAQKNASQSEITFADSAVIHSKENSQVQNDVNTNWKPPGPSSEEKASEFSAPLAEDVNSERSASTPTLHISTPDTENQGQKSPGSSELSRSNTPTTPVRVETTITLTGSPRTHIEQEESAPSSGLAGTDYPASNDLSSDFTLPRTVDIDPNQVIVHTGPTYHSPDEATTSFITDDQGGYSIAPGHVTSSIFHHQPQPGPISPCINDWYNTGAQRSQTDDDVNIGESQTRRRRRDRQTQVRRRQRQSFDDTDFSSTNGLYGDTMALNINRDEAMMEGTRMLMDNLREKVSILEEKVDKMDREKAALADLLTVKKSEYVEMRSKYRGRISDLEDDVNRLTSEKDRVVEKLKLPESERSALISSDKEIAVLNKKIEELENQQEEVLDDNVTLKQEVKDLQLEMEEMHDQFREEEALEFRELQKELEATAKNCRILQFKLRKSERRNEQMDNERLQYEDKIRQLESRFKKSDDKQHIHELEEELKMAKEVSVRLHDELELVEEKRARYEEELDRVNDILTESESRRQALQREVAAITDELERQRTEEQDNKTANKNTLGVPARAPLLGQTKKDGSKEGSMEYDVAQLMRDLSDSLERENDLKEQLKFAEEEAGIVRKKMSDMDEENESLQLQLQKLSSAKSPKHYRKKDAGDYEIVTEREHDLRLQMELAENEVKVLKRKLDEMEQQNENLLGEVKFLQAKMDGKIDGKEYKLSIDDDERPLEEQISSMAIEIDSLKWKLTEKDIEAEDKMKGGRGILKKSKSLEEDMHGPGRGILADAPDMRSQLDRVEQEANVLKEKLLRLEKENERLFEENKKLQLLSSRKLPAITADDAAMQNIELQVKVAKLESDNTSLRDSLKSLDDQTAQLSKQASTSYSQESDENSMALREQLKNVDEDCRRHKRKITELESANTKLTRELQKYKKEDDESVRADLKKLSKEEMEERVLDLESELKGLINVLKNREEEIDKLETDIVGTKFDMDKLAEVFKQREEEILEEAEMVLQKNNVLSNLLDLVTERAESTQKELEKYVKESETSLSSPTSPTSEDVPEKKEKKKKGSGEKGKVLVTKEWEAEMKKRVDTLEHALAEARQKLEAKEKKLEMKDSKMTGIKRETKVNKKEMEVLQKELALCTKQLRESVEDVRDLKTRLGKMQDTNKSLKNDYDKVSKELEDEKVKMSSLETSIEQQKEKSTQILKPEKEPASWRWEKKQLEDNVRDLEKNVDKLKSELKQQHFKWKLAGEDKEKENKMKEKLDNKMQKLKKEVEENQTALEEAKSKIESLQEGFKRNEDQWTNEKHILEDNAKAAEKELQKKEEAFKLKDDIIAEKDQLIKEKNKTVKDKEKSLKKMDDIIKSRNEEIQEIKKTLDAKIESASEIKASVSNLKTQLVEKEQTIKDLHADMRRRDDRIKEKDDILDKINRKLKEREQEYNDMDNSIRQIMKKLQDKEVEVNSLKSSADKNGLEVKRLNRLVSDLQTQMEKSELKSSKDYSDVCAQRDKLDSELSTVQKEKKTLLSDLDSAKEQLKAGEDKRKKEKTKLDLEIKQFKEKLHSLELSRTMKQGDVVKTLSNEKEVLITEKHKLSDEVNKLKKQSREATKQWNTERDDLQKIIAEKTTMVEDNNSICERMQKEIDNLKSRVNIKSPASPKLIPIQVQHESAQMQSFPVRVMTEPDKKSKDKTGDKKSTELSVGKERELQIKLEQKDLTFKAEKAGLEELYEGRIKLSQDNLAYMQEQASSLKKENAAQFDILQGSRKALADLRSRYDAALLSWNEERDRLEKKVKQVDNKSEGNEVDKQLKEIQVKLMEAEAKAKSAEVKLAAEKNAWKVEKAALEKKVKAAPASSATSGPSKPSGGVSEFRARFEKFEKKPAAPKPGAAVSTVAEDKAVTEAQKAIKDLKKQMDTMEKEREKSIKELLEKIEKQQTGTIKKSKTSDKEKKELQERNAQLEKKVKDSEESTKSLIDLQYKVHEEREQWQIEKKQIHKQLEDTRQSQMSDKEKINELLAEVKKLKTLTPMLENGQTERRSRLRRTPSIERQRTVIALSKADDKKDTADADDEVKRTLDQALEHISRLAEAFSQAPAQVPLRTSERKSQAPPHFRRSLSTSELEDGAQTYVSRAPDSLILYPYSTPVAQTTPSPFILPKPPAPDRPSRSRETGRSLSTQDGQYESATVDRRSFRAGVGQEAKRSSIHASGTMSAMTSRDASPEKGFRPRKITPYPAAPPSMIITPSHTPRRAPSLDRNGEDPLSKNDIAQLYAKLGEIEKKESDARREKALEKERKSVRVLTKSQSVEDGVEDRSPVRVLPSSSYTSTDPPRIPAHTSVYTDAVPSKTPAASIRVSGLVLTPGIEKISQDIRQQKKEKKWRSASVSPKTARKKFYDDYPYDPKNIFRRMRKTSSSDISSAGDSKESTLQKQKSAPAERLTFASPEGTEKEKDKGMFSSAANFFDAVKQKRKMFGSKKSASVDNSAVHAGIARMGTTVLPTPAAPSTYEPPAVPDPPVTKEKKKRNFLHRRSASIDAGSLFSSGRRSHSTDRQPLIPADASGSDAQDSTKKSDGIIVEARNSRTSRIDALNPPPDVLRSYQGVDEGGAIPPPPRHCSESPTNKREQPGRCLSMKKAIQDRPIIIKTNIEQQNEKKDEEELFFVSNKEYPSTMGVGIYAETSV